MRVTALALAGTAAVGCIDRAAVADGAEADAQGGGRDAGLQDAGPADARTAPDAGARDALSDAVSLVDLARLDADAGPVPDAGVAEVRLRLRRSLQVLTERRVLALTDLSAEDPRRGPHLVDAHPASLWRNERPYPGWSAAARRLPDGDLVVAEAEDCSLGYAVTRVGPAGARFMGRHDTGTCGTFRAEDFSVSPDGLWFSGDRWQRKVEPTDPGRNTAATPQCPDGRFSPAFDAWDTDGSVLASDLDCLMRFDPVTGASEVLQRPESSCRVLGDETGVALRWQGRLVLSCRHGLATVLADGTAEWLAPDGAAYGEAVLRTPRGPVILLQPDESDRPSVALLADEGVHLAPLEPGTESARLVPDTLGGEALVAGLRPLVVGITHELIVSGWIDERLGVRMRAPLPAGRLQSVVIGDARVGPVFVTLYDRDDRYRSFVLRGGGLADVEELPDADDCRFERWPGETGRAFLACDDVRVVDARRPVSLVESIGRASLVVPEGDHLLALSHEPVASLSAVAPSGETAAAEQPFGAPRWLGEIAGTGVVAYAPVISDPTWRVAFYPPGALEPAPLVPLVGEPLGLVGDRVLAFDDRVFGDERLQAVPSDGMSPVVIPLPRVFAAHVWLAPELGATVFLLDDDTIRRFDFDGPDPHESVVATDFAGWGVTAFLVDDAADRLVIVTRGAQYILPASPARPVIAPLPGFVAGWHGDLHATLSRGGVWGALWNDETVWTYCTRGPCGRRSARLPRFVPTDDDEEVRRFEVSPDGRYLVGDTGAVVDLDRPAAPVDPLCEDGMPCGQPFDEHDLLPRFEWSGGGGLVRVNRDVVLRPADGTGIGVDDAVALAESGLVSMGGAYPETVTWLNERLRVAARAFWPGDWHGWPDANPRVLPDERAVAVWWSQGSESRETVTDLYLIGAEPGGPISPALRFDGRVVEVW